MLLFHGNWKTVKNVKSVPKFIFSKGICGTAEFRAVPIQAATCLMRPSFVPILSERSGLFHHGRYWCELAVLLPGLVSFSFLSSAEMHLHSFLGYSSSSRKRLGWNLVSATQIHSWFVFSVLGPYNCTLSCKIGID